MVKNGCLPDEDGEIDTSDFEELSYHDMTLSELKDLAKEKGLKNYSNMTKEEIIKELEAE